MRRYDTPLCGVTTLANVSTLKDVAESLARAGYAVLSFDKRTCHAGLCAGRKMCTFVYLKTGLPAGIASGRACLKANNTLRVPLIRFGDFVDDAKAALAYLRCRTNANVGSVLIGHSQGTTVAALVADQLSKAQVAAVVLLAGFVQTTQKIMLQQERWNLQLCKNYTEDTTATW